MYIYIYIFIYEVLIIRTRELGQYRCHIDLSFMIIYANLCSILSCFIEDVFAVKDPLARAPNAHRQSKSARWKNAVTKLAIFSLGNNTKNLSIS